MAIKMDTRKIVAVVLLLHTIFKMTVALTTKFQAAHNSNATLFCDYLYFKMPVSPWQIYWILPNETVIQPWPKFTEDSKYHISYPPVHYLTIKNLNHKEFGWYYCVILWDNYHYLMDSVKVGLNVDGALYDDLYEEYTGKAITGSVAAGVVFVIFSLGCAVWHFRCREEKPDPKDLKALYEFDEAIRKFDEAVDDNETDTEERDKRDDDITEAKGILSDIKDVHAVEEKPNNDTDDKFNNDIDEACGYSPVMRNRAYVPDGQEDVEVDTITLNENYQNVLDDDQMTGATAF